DADPRPPAARRDGADEREAEIAGFSWVSPTLAGLPRPGRSGDLASDLAFVASQDVHTLVSLTEAGLPKDTVAGHGMASQHIPVVDFQPPTQAQFDRFLALLAEAADTKTKIAVHCEAGRGRTGTMLAASFIAGGMTADEALTVIRRLRPGSVETPGQEQALAELASRLRSAHD
ncbi:MAG: dual specificity protein phosphatase family protein, partial [Nannocystaceae bacterium]|nr:dual specificity protein phosphatase family protein [Nannocystaceae bacterium]